MGGEKQLLMDRRLDIESLSTRNMMPLLPLYLMYIQYIYVYIYVSIGFVF